MKLIQRRICKLEGASALTESRSQQLVAVLERRHRRLVAAGIPDEPVDVQLRKLRDRWKTKSASGARMGLAEIILASRKLGLQDGVA